MTLTYYKRCITSSYALQYDGPCKPLATHGHVCYSTVPTYETQLLLPCTISLRRSRMCTAPIRLQHGVQRRGETGHSCAVRRITPYCCTVHPPPCLILSSPRKQSKALTCATTGHSPTPSTSSPPPYSARGHHQKPPSSAPYSTSATDNDDKAASAWSESGASPGHKASHVRMKHWQRRSCTPLPLASRAS